jgi:hypothetical protein
MGKPVNGRLPPATFDTVPSTPPEGFAFGFATVVWVPSTPPTGGLALCVPTEAFDVLLDELELVLDDVFELVLDDVFELVFVDVFELVFVDVLKLGDEPHDSEVGTTSVDTTSPTTALSLCFVVKCADFGFVIRCSFLPCSTPTTPTVFVVTVS